MAATFTLEVATPDRLLVQEPVTEAEAPGLNGYLGILPEHAPLLTELRAGEVSYVTSGKKQVLVVGGGWMEVLPDRVRILAVSAELPSEIDLTRAQAALDRAEKRLKESGDFDIARAVAAAERARARLQVAGGGGRFGK